MKIKQIVLYFAGFIILLSIVVLAWANYAKEHYQTPWIKLEDRLPREIAGWSSVDLPLADTERVKEAVEDHLNYDDYIYRRYSRGSDQIYVYAMFWRQGRISVREMAGHTPDGCWIANGAKPIGDRKQAKLSYFEDKICPGEFRFFEFTGAQVPVNVLWWHVWGGEIVSSSLSKKSPFAVLQEVWTWLWIRKGRPADQIFIRVHTLGKLDSETANPVVIQFLGQFPELSVNPKS